MYFLYPILPHNPGKDPIMKNKQFSLLLFLSTALFRSDTKLGAWCQSWAKVSFSSGWSHQKFYLSTGEHRGHRRSRASRATRLWRMPEGKVFLVGPKKMRGHTTNSRIPCL